MDNGSEYIGPPYGPVANLKTIFETWRDRSMPEQVDRNWLERIGISSNLVPKNLHALRFLALIDEDGFTTPIAERLKVATSEEYPSVLEEIIRKAYRLVFEIRNPSEDSRLRIEDAFRREMPQAQRKRMVALFLGLCQLALIPLKEAPLTRAPRDGRGQTKRARVTPAAEPLGEQAARHASLEEGRRSADIYDPILVGLVDRLPQVEDIEGLDRWFEVFKSAFALVKNLDPKRKSEVA